MRLGSAAVFLSMIAAVPAALAQFSASASSPAFDAPLRQRIVNLGPSPYGGHVKLTCAYYPGFMVKQLDVGAEGAAWFGIIPERAGHPALCSKAHPAAEKTISGKEWCGYLQGVKGHYVFFSACNAYNGAQDFAIYDGRTGKKIFEDSAVDSGSGEVTLAQGSDGSLLLHYARVVVFDCTLPTDRSGCWSTIATRLGLENASAPTCIAYEKQMKGSVIAYPVEVALTAAPAARAVPGEIRCWPPE